MQNKNRKSIRLKDFDYSSPSDYFITICSHNRECLFGKIVDGEMVLNEVGRIIKRWVSEISSKYNNVGIDIYTIMPNHMHVIVSILCEDLDCRGGVPPPDNENVLMQGGETPPLQDKKPTISQIVGYFKYQLTKQINILKNTPGNHIWQRNYHEHIIRNQKSYDEIYSYIESNSQTWSRDRNNPENFCK